MADTKDFDVIRVCRSDGADTGPGYWPVSQPATANSLKKMVADKAPRAKPQMTRLAEDDPRFTEWRVKLGILLKQELSQSPDGETPFAPSTPSPSSIQVLTLCSQMGFLGTCRSPGGTGSMKNQSISGCLGTQSSQSCSKRRKSLPSI